MKKEEEIVIKKEIKEEIEEIVEEKKKEKKTKKEKKENKKVKKAKQAAGPMHFTANNEPRALDVLGDLDPSIFNEVTINYVNVVSNICIYLNVIYCIFYIVCSVKKK